MGVKFCSLSMFFRFALGILLFALVVSSLQACAPEHDANSPWLTNLRYDGQAQDNALVLLMSVDFEDGDGDLGVGELHPLVNGEESGEEPLLLKSIFALSDLALNATQGRLAFNFEVLMDLDPQYRPDPGSTFDIGVEMLDAAGNKSNHPSLYMRIDYP